MDPVALIAVNSLYAEDRVHAGVNDTEQCKCDLLVRSLAVVAAGSNGVWKAFLITNLSVTKRVKHDLVTRVGNIAAFTVLHKKTITPPQRFWRLAIVQPHVIEVPIDTPTVSAHGNSKFSPIALDHQASGCNAWCSWTRKKCKLQVRGQRIQHFAVCADAKLEVS